MFKDIELGSDGKFKLESLEIGITSACNLSCDYCCAYGKDDGSFLDGNRVISIIKDLKDLKRVKLSGGEVLLYFEDCRKIVEYCTQNGIGTQINTNGTTLNPEKIKQLKEAGLGTLHFSVNFNDEEGYCNYYKQPRDMFYLHEKILKTSVDMGINVVAEMILFNETSGRIIELFKYLSTLGIYQIEVQIGIAMERSGWDKVVFKNEIRDAINLIALNKTDQMDIYFSCLPEAVLEMVDRERLQKQKVYFPKCIDGSSQLHLHSNGDVLICELGYPKVLGNIFHRFDLQNALESCYQQLKEFRDCHKCAKYNTYN